MSETECPSPALALRPDLPRSAEGDLAETQPRSRTISRLRCSWLRLKARNRGELGRRSIRRLGEESGRTISATRPRLSTVWGWRALACPQDANSTIAEMALGAALPFGRGCLPPL